MLCLASKGCAPRPSHAVLGPCGYGEQCTKDPETHAVKSELQPTLLIMCVPACSEW